MCVCVDKVSAARRVVRLLKVGVGDWGGESSTSERAIAKRAEEQLC